jgi:hypothetical protein
MVERLLQLDELAMLEEAEALEQSEFIMINR